MELATILQRCRKGDELAWEALVRQYQSRVFGLAFHYVGNPEDARDLAQEIFVRIFEKLHLCTDAERFLPWLITTARNRCVDYLRRRKARPPASDIPAEEMVQLRDDRANPLEQWTEGSRKQLIYLALREMTELNREIILLKEIEGLSMEEVASLLKIPLGTVKSRSHRARLELARELLVLGGFNEVSTQDPGGSP